VRDHTAIVRALADGRPARAEAALRDHLSRSLA
jgi:DNA-binding GntR family transcriptional regulator